MSLGQLLCVVTKMGATAYVCGFFMALFALITSSIRRMPQRATYLLMFLVLFRMICPVSVSSRWSVLNSDFVVDFGDNYSAVNLLNSYAVDFDVAVEGSAAWQEAIDAGLTPTIEDMPYAIVYTRDAQGRMIPPPREWEVRGNLYGGIWLGGIALFWGYGAVSYLLLKRKVSTATRVEDMVYESDRIKTPFILGFVHPKIYLPMGLDETQRRYVLCHEREHIRHGDHIVKALVYAIMSVHWHAWFLWLYFYRMFTAEVELACDSDVLARLGEEHKADYSQTLLSLSGGRHVIGAVPCAFGENSTKERVRMALKFRRPTPFWRVLAWLLVLCAAVICGTNAV